MASTRNGERITGIDRNWEEFKQQVPHRRTNQLGHEITRKHIVMSESVERL